jgi:hypothetical protein
MPGPLGHVILLALPTGPVVCATSATSDTSTADPSRYSASNSFCTERQVPGARLPGAGRRAGNICRLALFAQCALHRMVHLVDRDAFRGHQIVDHDQVQVKIGRLEGLAGAIAGNDGDAGQRQRQAGRGAPRNLLATASRKPAGSCSMRASSASSSARRGVAQSNIRLFSAALAAFSPCAA